MPKKSGNKNSGRGKSEGEDHDDDLLQTDRSNTKKAPWLSLSIGGVLVSFVLGWLLSTQSGGGQRLQDEAPLQPDAMMASMQRIEDQKPVALADFAHQLRFFCSGELDSMLISTGGPPTRQPPRTSDCMIFVKMMPRIDNVISLKAASLGEPLSKTVAQNLDMRLLALARLEVDYDAIQNVVLLLTQWMQNHELGWPMSMTALLTVHLLHGDEQPHWEHELTRLRSEFISGMSGTFANEAGDLFLPAAIACQAKLTDYAWRELPNEGTLVDKASKSLAEGLVPTDLFARTLLVVVGSYKPLLPIVRHWETLGAWRAAYQTEKDKADSSWTFWQLWRLAVEEPLAQLALREKLHASVVKRGSTKEIGEKVEGSASSEVRAMYERNPYPSWSWMRPPVDWPAKLFDWLRSKHWQVPDDWPASSEKRPKVLVAGCGTGHWMTHFARHYKDHADVLAVDLSLSSLAFAARRVEENHLGNVRLEQADILDLPEVVKKEAPFDFIEVGGVLHHLRNPEDGWSRLVELLRPGGVMLVALYSKIARRQGVDPCRNFADKGGYNASSAWSLRRYRADVMKQREAGEKWATQITTSRDFASLSGVRDLCLHIQETQYTMLEIEEIMSRLGLRWLQMAETVSEEKQRFFKDFIGMDPFSAGVTPSLWHKFEEKYPTTFLGMYEFFVQRCQGGDCKSV